MRSVELAKVAAAAEVLRLRRFSRRQVHRLEFAIIAVLFALAAFTAIHVVLFQAFLSFAAPWVSALLLVVIDGFVAVIFGLLALNSRPDRVEQEALQVRQQSLIEARKALTIMSVAGQVAGIALGRGTRRAIRGSRLAQFGVVADIASRFIRRR